MFFSGNHETMTFTGFHLQLNGNGSMDAINQLNGKIIKKDVMTEELYRDLLYQGVPFNVDFNNLPRHKKNLRLCQTLGIPWALDLMKHMSLQQTTCSRFWPLRCGSSVGSQLSSWEKLAVGKTRLIKFHSDL